MKLVIAVAVDYEANIAASVNILINKWIQLHLEPSGYEDTLNNDNTNYIENCFLALGLQQRSTQVRRSQQLGYDFLLPGLSGMSGSQTSPPRCESAERPVPAR